MVTRYGALEEFDDRRERTLRSVVEPDERFVFGIEAYHGWFFWKRRATLVLTDQRVIELKQRLVHGDVRDVALDRLDTITYQEGRFLRLVTIEGSGFNAQYRTVLGLGQEFVEKAAERLERAKTTR